MKIYYCMHLLLILRTLCIPVRIPVCNCMYICTRELNVNKKTPGCESQFSEDNLSLCLQNVLPLIAQLAACKLLMSNGSGRT